MPERGSSLLRVPRRWLPVAAAAYLAVIAVGFAARSWPALRLFSVDRAVNSVNAAILDDAARVLDAVDRPVVVAGVLLVVFAAAALVWNWRRALGISIVTGLGWLTTIGVKLLVDMPRPDATSLAHLVPVDPATQSFPSGHTVFLAALTTALVLGCRSRADWLVGGVGAIAVLVMGWSRLYLGVHYPADILGGVLNGIGGALLFAGIWNLLARRIWREGRRGRHAVAPLAG